MSVSQAPGWHETFFSDSDTALSIVEDRDAQLKRIQQYLLLNLPGVAIAEALLFALYVIYGHPMLAWLLALPLVEGVLYGWAWVQTRRGQLENAVVVMGFGFWIIALCLAVYFPRVYLIMTVVAIWPVVLALPYIGGRRLIGIIAGSLVTVVVVLLLSPRESPIVPDPVPDWAYLTAQIGVTPVLLAYLCHLLWQYSSRLTGTLRATREANDALRHSERHLEIRVRDRTAELAERNADLVQSQSALAAARDEAIEATQTKSEFLANMSHELRTPLNAIIGFSEVLLDPNMPLDDAMREQFQGNILTSGRHLLNLINDILDLSKVEAGKMELHPETFSVAEALEGVLAIVRPLAHKKSLLLELDIAPSLASTAELSTGVNSVHAVGGPGSHVAVDSDSHDGLVYHDPGRFKQVLYNLLSNAVKFTPDGGTVRTIANLVQPSIGDGTGERAVGPDTFIVAVSDTGIGIAPEDQAAVFAEFQQIDSGYARTQQGTGLGLALVKHMVELMGGTISLESALGQGSTFTVQLPLRQPEHDESTTPFSAVDVVGVSGTPGTNAHSPLVLVVEDDSSAASLLALHLSRAGFRVASATDGAQAIEQASTLHPDVITLDIMLPTQNGWAVLRQLKGEPATRAIPVVVISVTDDPSAAREASADAHLVSRSTRSNSLPRSARWRG